MWIHFRGEYFSGMNIFQGCIFSRGEYFSEVNIFKGLIFFIFFRGEYFSGLDISQFKSRIRTDYFGLVIFHLCIEQNKLFCVLCHSWTLWNLSKCEIYNKGSFGLERRGLLRSKDSSNLFNFFLTWLRNRRHAWPSFRVQISKSSLLLANK